MPRRLDRSANRPGPWILKLMLLAVCTAGLSACWIKDADFFAIEEALEDLFGPAFTDLRPAQAGWVLNDDFLYFNVTDPQGSNGAPPSGVDFNSVSAVNNIQLPLERDGNTFMAGIGGLSAGAHMIEVTAADNAGNTSSTFFDFTYDPDAPVIEIMDPPAGEVETDEAMFSLGISGTIMDPNLGGATIGLYRAGPDGTCGTTDDAMFESGTGPGQASPNMRDIELGPNGEFSTGFDLYNPLSSGDEPRREQVCARVEAEDAAVNVDGQPNPNRSIFFIEQFLFWQLAPVAPIVIACTIILSHGSTESLLRALLDIPLLAGRPFRAVFSGPEGGVDGDGVHTGTLDSAGAAEILQRIFLFGLYLLALNITAPDGTEHSTTVEIDVGAEEMTYQCAE